ncbi:MAG: glycosyltransferase [Polyangiaceae bacterium]|nr:glycosyltransferase [Polyangiaceae bacterium]
MSTENKLTFLSVAPEWDSAHGGLSTVNREFCRALARVGHNVICALPSASPDEVQRAAADRVRLVFPRKSVGPVGLAALYRRLPIDHPVDVVIGHGRITGNQAKSQRDDNFQDAEYVHFVHMDPTLLERLKPPRGGIREKTIKIDERIQIEVDLGREATLVVAIGPELRDTYSTYLHPYGKQVHQFVPGLFESDWAQESPPGVQVLLFGRAEDVEIKGIDIAAKAMSLVCEDERFRRARFSVLGAPDGEGDQLYLRLKEIGGERLRLDVLPFTPDRMRVRNAIRGSSLVLMPSREEGFGLAGLEAISEGIPVLISRTSGLARAIEQHLPRLVRPHIVDPGDGPEGLAKKINTILQDIREAFKNIRTLRDEMRPHFDWDEAARNFVRALQGRREGGPGPSDAPLEYSPLAASAVSAAAQSLARASGPLIEWQKNLRSIDKWLDRPELSRILESVRAEGAKPIVLLGPPGSGKSALLSRVVVELLDRDVAVLAIKADRLTKDIADINALSEEIGLRQSADAVLVGMAKARKTLLVIDQLDALGDLVDLHTDRLSVLLDLVDSVRSTENVVVLMSCRATDYRHDIRFKRLGAEEIQLELPPEEVIAGVLIEQGIDAKTLSPRLLELLRVPQSLDVFLQLRVRDSQTSPFESYQEMLEAFWVEHFPAPVERNRALRLAGEIASLMSEREELWLSAPVFASLGADPASVDLLLNRGILVRDPRGQRQAFAHQTIFEFVRGRAFASGIDSLAAYVMKRQDSLFVRPTLWTSLAYLRAMDQRTYLGELESLWQERRLRLHVRALLIDFLGQVEAPVEREQAIGFKCLRDDMLRSAFLEAAAGRKSWFSLLRPARLPQLMEHVNEYALVEFLTKAVEFAPEEVGALLEAHWRADKTKHDLLATTLFRMSTWPAGMQDLAIHVIREGNAPSVAGHLIHTAIECAPEHAPALIAAELRRQIEEISSAAANSADELRDLALSPYGRLLEDKGHLFMIDAAEAAPKPFLEHVWPLFVDVASRISETDSSRLCYRQDYSKDTSPESVVGVEEMPASLSIAISKVAKDDPAFMTDFVRLRWPAQTMAVHRFLIFGIEQMLPESAALAFEYLVGDPRRLSVGDLHGVDNFSSRLIEQIAAGLDGDQYSDLSAMIGRSKWIDEADPDFSDAERQNASERNISHQDRLRKALRIGRDLPASVLRGNGTQRVPPSRRASRHLLGDARVKSPMSTEEMRDATNEQILRLFATLPAESERWAAVRSFAELAKVQPDRVLAMLPHFQCGSNETERPVASVLEPLAETVTLVRMEESIRLLHDLGFASEGFHTWASYALEHAARNGDTMSDDTLAMVVSWLKDAPLKADDKVSKRSDAKQTGPILFGWRPGGFLPQGNYPPLMAITAGCLRRSPADLEAWLTILELHLDRREEPAVWYALARDLEGALGAPKARAERFFSRLFDRFPNVRDSVEGCVLVAQAMHYLPLSAVQHWMKSIEAGGWEHRHQAVGELLVMLATRDLAPTEANERVFAALDGLSQETEAQDGTVLGIAHAAAHCWHVPGRRKIVTEILLRLLPVATGNVAEAAMAMFASGEALLWDDATEQILQMLLKEPRLLLLSKPSRLIDGLRDIILDAPSLVTDVALAIVRESATAKDFSHTAWNGPELVDIAMTLQRLGSPVRERGLDLFEALLAVHAYGARDVLAELDPLRRTPPMARSARRRRKAKP